MGGARSLFWSVAGVGRVLRGCWIFGVGFGFVETPVTMSERVTFVLITVLSPLHSVVGDDIFSVRANTMFVNSLICLFISMKR